MINPFHFIEKYSCLEISISTLQLFLLPCRIRVFFSNDLFRVSDTSATRIDLFNVHVLFTCNIAIFQLARCLMLVLMWTNMPYMAQFFI